MKRKLENSNTQNEAKKIRECKKRSSGLADNNETKRSKMEQLVAKFVPRMPFGWNLYMSKFMEPKTDSAIVPYRSLEERVLNKPPL